MQSRKMAVYFIANLALKALLKVGNVDGCEKVVVTVVTKAAALAAFSQYPKSDQVSCLTPFRLESDRSIDDSTVD